MPDEQPTLQARLMRLIGDADRDAKIKEGAERTAAIYEETYGKNFAAVMGMLEDIDQRSTATAAHVEGMRGQFAQIVGNQPMIIDLLTRQEERDKERLQKDADRDRIIAQLVKDVGAIGKRQAQGARESRSIIKRLDALEGGLRRDAERLDKKRIELDELHTEVSELRSRLDARPTPEQAQATYQGVKRILEHLGLGE